MYHVFAGLDYYPDGGAHDYQLSAVTKEEALEAIARKAIRSSWDWWHITDEDMLIQATSND